MPRLRAPAAPLPAPALLRLMWLASPALPVGGFSYSEGLEAAIDAGRVRTDVEVRDWLVDQLNLVQSRSELPLVAKAHGAWRRHDAAHVQELNDWVRMSRESAEMRVQTEQMGRSLLEWLRQRDGGALAPEPRVATLAALPGGPTWPVAYALAAWLAGAPVREALLAHAFAWAENMVQAALKAVPLGQSAGQRVLGWLVEAMPAACDHALGLSDGERQAFAPGLAILSARHEAQYSRLFRS